MISNAVSFIYHDSVMSESILKYALDSCKKDANTGGIEYKNNVEINRNKAINLFITHLLCFIPIYKIQPRPQMDGAVVLRFDILCDMPDYHEIVSMSRCLHRKYAM